MRSPGPRSGDTAWSERRLSDVYFDTPERALAAAGLGARLRTGDHPPTVTLKAAAGGDPASAIHRRHEIEGPATERLELADWPASTARDVLLGLAGDRPLVERFVLDQRRLERPIESGGARMMLSLDEIEVRRAGRRIGHFDMLEVELRAGPEEPLAAVGAQIEASGLVVREDATKPARAERLASAEQPGKPLPSSGRLTHR